MQGTAASKEADDVVNLYIFVSRMCYKFLLVTDAQQIFVNNNVDHKDADLAIRFFFTMLHI